MRRDPGEKVADRCVRNAQCMPADAGGLRSPKYRSVAMLSRGCHTILRCMSASSLLPGVIFRPNCCSRRSRLFTKFAFRMAGVLDARRAAKVLRSSGPRIPGRGLSAVKTVLASIEQVRPCSYGPAGNGLWAYQQEIDARMTSGQAASAKGMLLRGKKHHNVAAFCSVNGGVSPKSGQGRNMLRSNRRRGRIFPRAPRSQAPGQSMVAPVHPPHDVGLPPISRFGFARPAHCLQRAVLATFRSARAPLFYLNKNLRDG